MNVRQFLFHVGIAFVRIHLHFCWDSFRCPSLMSLGLSLNDSSRNAQHFRCLLSLNLSNDKYICLQLLIKLSFGKYLTSF
jgi:hypothetical protein